MPEINITELVATTLRNRSSVTADNISLNNALLSRLSQKGNIKTADGGRFITQPLLHAELANFMWYSGYETLDVSPNPVVDAAEFSWKQAAANVIWSGLEIRVQNAGQQQQIDLLESRMQAAEITMANQVAIGLYSDGTGTSGKQITGLAAALDTDPTTGTYGGIDGSVHTFWQNQIKVTASVSSNVTKLENMMRAMWLQCTRRGETPDLIVTEDVLYEKFWGELQAIQRVTETSEAIRGFNSLKFVTADVVYDGDTMDSASALQKMYFINTNYLFFRPHSGTNFTSLDERTPVNQDAHNVPMVFAGNLTMNQRRVHGVIATA